MWSQGHACQLKKRKNYFKIKWIYHDMSINSNYEHTIWDMLHVVKIWHEQRSLGKIVYYTFIPNYSNLEATKKFFRRWVEKQTSVSKYYLIWKAIYPPSHEMQWTKRSYPKRLQSQNSDCKVKLWWLMIIRN